MSTFAQILAYFEPLAQALVAVQHNTEAALARFGTYEPEEVITGLKRKFEVRGSHLVLLVEKPEEVDSNADDNPVTEYRIGYVLMRQCGNEDFAAQKQAEDDARAAGRQIKAKIIRDARRFQFLNGTAQLANDERFEIEMIGPAFDECYGARFVFSWTENGGTTIDPAAWL